MIKFQRYAHLSLQVIWTITLFNYVLLLSLDPDLIILAGLVGFGGMAVNQMIRQTAPAAIDPKQTVADILVKAFLLGVILATTQMFTKVPFCPTAAENVLCVSKTIAALSTYAAIIVALCIDVFAFFRFALPEARDKKG